MYMRILMQTHAYVREFSLSIKQYASEVPGTEVSNRIGLKLEHPAPWQTAVSACVQAKVQQ